MLIARSVEELPRSASSGPAVVIGNLDGVHLGHQALIRSAKVAAAKGPTAVITFAPHPQEFLHPSKTGHRLTTDSEKFKLFEQYGVDTSLILAFDSKLASMAPEAFFKTYLANGLRAASVHVGHDFRFGSRRSGTAEMLQEMGEAAGIKVHIIPPVEEGGFRISSSRIRTLVQKGEMKEAAALLGRPYAMAGKVVEGSGRGRKLGIRTANVSYVPDKVAPRSGVYATRATVVAGEVGSKRSNLPGVANFGVRPTFEGANSASVLECHLLDFNADLYGQTLKVDFIEWIRDERKFESIEALRKQVDADIETARKRV